MMLMSPMKVDEFLFTRVACEYSTGLSVSDVGVCVFRGDLLIIMSM